MATLTYPYTFTPATTISSTEMNANFDAIATQINGLLDSTNLANAAVTENKLADLSVATAKIQALAVTEAKLGAAAVTDAKVATGIDAAKLGAGAVSNTEFGYLNGVTSALQTQLDAKLGLPANVSAMYVGRVDSTGTAVSLPAGWSATRLSLGTYQVTHNLGSTNLITLLTGHSFGGVSGIVSTATANDMIIAFASDGVTPYTNADSSFSFILFTF